MVRYSVTGDCHVKIFSCRGLPWQYISFQGIAMVKYLVAGDCHGKILSCMGLPL